MRYTIIGNGNPNGKEVVKTLSSLADDRTQFVLVGYDHPSPAMKSILKWLSLSYDYDLVVHSSFVIPDEYSGCARIITAKRPVARALAHSAMEAGDSSDSWRLLVMSDDLDQDEDALFAINACVDNGVEVFDLAGQMTPLTVEQDDPYPTSASDTSQTWEEPLGVAKALELANEAPDMLEDLTREELEGLTRDELKSIVSARGIHPKDMRSKESLIEAILGVTPEPPPSGGVLHEQREVIRNVATTDPMCRYYLLVVLPDQTVSVERISVEQFSQITF